MTTLKDRSVEDDITDVKRTNSQPGKLFLKEVVLETDIGSKSFSGDIGFAASIKNIFDDLSPSTALGRDEFASSLESIDQSRVEFGDQGGLEDQMSFVGISSSTDIQIGDRSGIWIPKRFLRTPSVKKETRRVAVMRDMDPPVKSFLPTSGNDWDNICMDIIL